MKWWDMSWNPFHGCTRCSEGCENCLIFTTLEKQKRPSAPAFERNALRRNLRSGITYSVCSLGDLFHADNSCADIDSVFTHMMLYPGNRYLVLTKRSRDMREYFSDADLPEKIRNGLWDSLWAGVTVESAKHLDRIDDLLETPVISHRFLCLSPLLDAVSIAPYLDTGRIGWVVVGVEIGENRRSTDVAWIRNVVRECGERHVPVFVSNVELPSNRTPAEDPEQFPEDLRVREFPWKTVSSVSMDYSGLHVLRREGWIGCRAVTDDDGTDCFDFCLYAPLFVHTLLEARMFGGHVGKAIVTTPLTYMSPRGGAAEKALIRETRDFVAKKYLELRNGGLSEKWLNMLLPQDVIVRFGWRIPVAEITENAGRLDDVVRDEKTREIREYLIAMKILVNRWRSQHVGSQPRRQGDQ